MKIDAPVRAMDASLVPITLAMPEKDRIAGLHLVIDDNPSPYAAKFTFGPASDPGEIKLRVRVNNYTNVHAVAETKDGRLLEAVKFVKASGGCSAPMGMSDEEAMKGMGDMRMKFAGEAMSGKPVEATLMIRHPNFSGMQMNQVTREYTPARYITKIEVSRGAAGIFTLDGDISISSNPVIGFSFVPQGGEAIRVVAFDNQNGRWEQSFTAPSRQQLTVAHPMIGRQLRTIAALAASVILMAAGPADSPVTCRSRTGSGPDRREATRQRRCRAPRSSISTASMR